MFILLYFIEKVFIFIVDTGLGIAFLMAHSSARRQSELVPPDAPFEIYKKFFEIFALRSLRVYNAFNNILSPLISASFFQIICLSTIKRIISTPNDVEVKHTILPTRDWL